jgi:replicative DNA helicase
MKNPNSTNETATIRIAKDRMGARGDLALNFHEQLVRFSNIERSQP